MSIQKVSDIIVDLIKQHRELTAIAVAKTETIKHSDMEALSKLLMRERKQIQVIMQLETERQKVVGEIFQTLHVESEEKTVTLLLEHIQDEENRIQLEQIVAELVEVIVELRQTEHLNEGLIQQSMEFVQLSLDMLQPTMKNMNYNEKSAGEQLNNKSVFDSRA